MCSQTYTCGHSSKVLISQLLGQTFFSGGLLKFSCLFSNICFSRWVCSIWRDLPSCLPESPLSSVGLCVKAGNSEAFCIILQWENKQYLTCNCSSKYNFPHIESFLSFTWWHFAFVFSVAFCPCCLQQQQKGNTKNKHIVSPRQIFVFRMPFNSGINQIFSAYLTATHIPDLKGIFLVQFRMSYYFPSLIYLQDKSLLLNQYT